MKVLMLLKDRKSKNNRCIFDSDINSYARKEKDIWTTIDKIQSRTFEKLNHGEQELLLREFESTPTINVKDRFGQNVYIIAKGFLDFFEIENSKTSVRIISRNGKIVISDNFDLNRIQKDLKDANPDQKFKYFFNRTRNSIRKFL